MKWYRRWTDRANSIQLHKVGFWGTAVFDALCDICAERDFGGRIPKAYGEVDFLIRQMNLQQADCESDHCEDERFETIERAFHAVVSVGLIISEGDFLIIDGWERRQPKVPKTSTERVRRYRQRLENINETKKERNETRFTMFPNVSETHETHIEKEKEKEKEKENESEKKEKKVVADATSEKPAKKKRETTLAPGRLQQLSRSLEASWLRIRGNPYMHGGGKDMKALSDLAQTKTDAEIIERWERGIGLGKYPAPSNFAQLKSNWNALDGKQGASSSPPTPKPQRLPTYEEIKHLYEPDPEYLKKKKEMGPDWY